MGTWKPMFARGFPIALVALVLCVVARPAYAQHDHEQSQYAGMEHSEVPSLTAQELDDLRSGAGMGFAKAAELNHYPGPRHALELAGAIELTDEQRRHILAIQSGMREDALQLGQAIIDAESKLNLSFRHSHVDEESLSLATREIALLYGELRFVHLRAHVATRNVLEHGQVAEYDRLRGYGGEN